MKSRIHRRFARKESSIGFQIAPMIDVVFVILLFFMVAAGQAKMENSLNTQLPGGPTGPISLPDEIIIAIDVDGNVSLNDEPMDSPDAKRLVDLQTNLFQLKRSADGVGANLLVTIDADEFVKYQRVVDVLDALNAAKISSVTFQAGSAD